MSITIQAHLTEEEIRETKEFVALNSKRYNYIKNIEKRHSPNATTTYAEFDAYIKAMSIAPSMMIKAEFKKLVQRNANVMAKNFITYKRFIGCERALCDKIINRNKAIKQYLTSRYHNIGDSENFNELSSDNGFISIDAFLCKNSLIINDVPGVFVFHNISTDLYYVGQSVNLYSMVNRHIHGAGNKNVYKDIKKGDMFEIKLIERSNCPYENLGESKMELIRYYDSIEQGYN